MRECVPPNCASMYPNVNPEGPPPMIRIGTLSDCSMVGVLLYVMWFLYIDIFNSVGIVHKKLHKAQDACYISTYIPTRVGRKWEILLSTRCGDGLYL